MIKGCNVFFGSKVGKHLRLCGRAHYRATRKNLDSRTQLDEPVKCVSGGDPLLLYEILHLLISFWYEFFVHNALRVEKKLSIGSSCGTFEISVSSAEAMSHQPIQNSVALFRGHKQNTRSYLP